MEPHYVHCHHTQGLTHTVVVWAETYGIGNSVMGWECMAAHNRFIPDWDCAGLGGFFEHQEESAKGKWFVTPLSSYAIGF